MGALTLQMRVLERAAELLGSERLLARRLRISMSDLFTLLTGRERPTQETFLAAVDVLIEFGDPDVVDSAGRIVRPVPLSRSKGDGVSGK